MATTASHLLLPFCDFFLFFFDTCVVCVFSYIYGRDESELFDAAELGPPTMDVILRPGGEQLII